MKNNIYNRVNLLNQSLCSNDLRILKNLDIILVVDIQILYYGKHNLAKDG